MRILLYCLLSLTVLPPLAAVLHAQTAEDDIAPPVATDDLAPLAPSVPAAGTPGSAPARTDTATATSTDTATAAGTTTTAATPGQPGVYADIMISSVTVVVPDSTGLERDKALQLAARQALPEAMQQMDPPVAGEKADTFINSQGDLTRYVKTVRIIKEVLVPSYTLTADLTFDAAKLYANLGGRIPALASAPASASIHAPVSPSSPSATAPVALQTIKVQLASASPADQARLYRLLNQLPGSTAHYDAITTQDAAYTLQTALTPEELARQLTAQRLSAMPGPAGTVRVSF